MWCAKLLDHGANVKAVDDNQNQNEFARSMQIQKLLEAVERHELAQEATAIASIARAKDRLASLERILLLQKAIANMNQKTIAEIRSFDSPSSEIVDCMKCVFLLLGEDPKKLVSWKKTRVLIGKMGKLSLKRKIASFHLTAAQSLPAKVVQEARELNDKVDVKRVTDVSQGAATFYAWCKGVLEELS